MKTIGDLVKGAIETYGILKPHIEDKNWVDWEVLSSDSEESVQEKVISLPNIPLVDSPHNVHISEMEQIYRILAESFAFDKPIKRLTLNKTKKDNYQDCEVRVEFKDGLCTVADVNPHFIYCSLERNFEIIPELQPKLGFKYEVTPAMVFTDFRLQPDQIPSELFFPNFFDYQAKKSSWDESSVEAYANADITNRLNKRAEEILSNVYRTIQKELLEGRPNWLGIEIEHMPKSELYPIGAIVGDVYYNAFTIPNNPLIAESQGCSYEKKKAILNTPLHEITLKFDRIEEAVRDVYKNLNIKELENLKSLLT